MLGLPGAPTIYHGDEYGQYGGVDPNNRTDWRGASGTLSSDEQATLAWTQKLGVARHALTALRRGAYVPVYGTDANVLVFARQDAAGDVALSRLDTPATLTFAPPPSLGLTEGTTLHGGQGAAILAP
jgi:glycosidase